MIRASELRGRSVVDVNAGERLGTIDDVILDPAGRQVAGYVVSERPGLLGGKEVIVPGSAVHAIGPDAVTVRRGEQSDAETGRLGPLPRLTRVTGRKMVSESGRLLGTIHDILLADDGMGVVGYALGSGSGGGLGNLLGRDKDQQRYVRADSDLRVGYDVIVVPDDAVLASGERADAAPPVERRAVEEGTAPGAVDDRVEPDAAETRAVRSEGRQVE